MSDVRKSDVSDDASLQVAATVVRGGFTLEVDFVVAPGEVLGVIGPNGAGKTTLLRALAGLAALDSGRISLGGQVLDDAAAQILVPAEQRAIGLVFQNYRLFPHLSVRDNVAFAARSQGAGRTRAAQRADLWLAHLDLVHLGRRKPAQLSGGQAQRVAIARALASEPDLLLLDEPLAALDASTRLELRGSLRRHLATFRGPTLLVTHDPLEAMVLTDRLLVIEAGRIVQVGRPAEVARRPATQYVARLVGLNLYAGRRLPSGAIAVDTGGELVAPRDAAAGPNGRVLVALRPAAIAVHRIRPERSSPRNVWPGRICGLQLLVDRVRIEVDGDPPALVDVTPDAVAELDLTAGAPVWLSAKATDLDVYPDTSADASVGGVGLN